MGLLASLAKHILHAEKATLIRGAVELDNTMFALRMISSSRKDIKGLFEFPDGITRIKQLLREKGVLFYQQMYYYAINRGILNPTDGISDCLVS